MFDDFMHLVVRLRRADTGHVEHGIVVSRESFMCTVEFADGYQMHRDVEELRSHFNMVGGLVNLDGGDYRHRPWISRPNAPLASRPVMRRRLVLHSSSTGPR